MTFVCDLSIPGDLVVNLYRFAETVALVGPSEFGVVGVSGQVPNPADGGRLTVISRGVVKDARRHFAHQVQLRLRLSQCPNASVKVFSTGRCQVAGCRSEDRCVETVQFVANVLNDVKEVHPEVFVRREVGGALLDPAAIVSAETVMINSSFDAGFCALGFGLDPVTLAEIVRGMRVRDRNITEVSYSAEQRYTGVKVKYRVQTERKTKSGNNHRDIFIGIFPSAKCVITGAVLKSEIDVAFAFVRAVLLDNFDQIRTVSQGPPRGGRAVKDEVKEEPLDDA
jgi:hypothetical protein